MKPSLALFALSLSLLAGLAIAPAGADCGSGAVRLVTGYDSAADSVCRRGDAGAAHFSLVIAPEAEPINPSPWYAFTLDGAPGRYQVELIYAAAAHRYAPWIRSGDGHWIRLGEDRVVLADEGRRAVLDVTLGAAPLQVAAQPPYTLADYASLERRWPGPWRTIGHSVEGRDLRALILEPLADVDGWVLVLGRQHPPEVPGAWALDAFVDEALRLREAGLLRSGLIVIPVLNPDGVEAGYWRLNENRVDLNRDWRARTQPEVLAVFALLDALSLAQSDLALMVDFHATVAERLYLPQPEELPAEANARLDAWLAAMEADGVFETLEPMRTNPRRRVSAKAVFTDDWRTVAVTWEAGDETAPDLVRDHARRAAHHWALSRNGP